MILGLAPSISATAELVVPRSIPMTGPLTFSPSSPLMFSAYPLLNCVDTGVLNAGDLNVEVARGTACMRLLDVLV